MLEISCYAAEVFHKKKPGEFSPRASRCALCDSLGALSVPFSPFCGIFSDDFCGGEVRVPLVCIKIGLQRRQKFFFAAF